MAEQQYSTAKLAEFREKLLRLNEEIELVLERTRSASATVKLDQNRVGRLSRMDAMQGQAMAQAGLARQKQVLQEVGKALEKIELGEFGRCEECDEMIALARLDFDPTSAHCIQCAALLEDQMRGVW